MANEAKLTILLKAAAGVEATADATLDEGTVALPSLRGMLRQLFAAAPTLLRALVAVEWSGDLEWPECPECRRSKGGGAHRLDCRLDAALTAAGLETQEQRDAVRRSI